MDCVQGIEPSSCLVNTLCDEVGSASELGCFFASEAFLRIRHRTGVEPHVNKVALACHLLPGIGNEIYIVHIRTVQVNLIVVFLAHIVRSEALILQRIGGHNPGFYGFLYLSVEFFQAADALLFLAVFCTPDRKRCTPESAS